jgi:hypothetical protein
MTRAPSQRSGYSCSIMFIHECTPTLPTHSHVRLDLQLHTDQKIVSFLKSPGHQGVVGDRHIAIPLWLHTREVVDENGEKIPEVRLLIDSENQTQDRLFRPQGTSQPSYARSSIAKPLLHNLQTIQMQ